MMHLDLSLGDLPRLTRDGKGLDDLGEDAFEPFKSPFLSSESVRHGEDIGLWVGEERDPSIEIARLDGVVARVRAIDSYEGIKVVLSLEPTPTITIVRTLEGSTPLYLADVEGRFVASWQFERVCAALPVRRADVVACRRFLEHSQTRTRNQVIDGVFMLWPGERATLNADGLRFEVAKHHNVALPGSLTDDARVTDILKTLIADRAKHAVARSTETAIEISGGLDSSCVAVALADRGHHFRSYGVIQPGIVGEQQRRRRTEITTRLEIQDYASSATECTPIKSLQIRECQLSILDDLYRMQCVSALDGMTGRSVTCVVTGIGGDELTKEYVPFHPEWELPGIQASSAVLAAASRADMFLRRGIWPINPLTCVRVVNFCRALPPDIREKRQLNTLMLARAGLSDGFIFPRLHEHFGSVLSADENSIDYEAIFEDSSIADLGIANISTLLLEVRKASLYGMSLELLSRLYNHAKLDSVLRRHLSP